MLLQQNNFLTWSRSQLFHCLDFTRADSVQFFGQAQCQLCTERFSIRKWASKAPSPALSQNFICLWDAFPRLWVNSPPVSEHLQRERSYLLHEWVWKYSDVHIQKHVLEKACMGDGWEDICAWCVIIMFSFTQCLLHAQGNVTKCNENHISLQIKGQRETESFIQRLNKKICLMSLWGLQELE